MATIKQLDTFVLRDELNLNQNEVLTEAQACAFRRAETMGWINVSARPTNVVTIEGNFKCYKFEIWGTEIIMPPNEHIDSNLSQDKMLNDAVT